MSAFIGYTQIHPSKQISTTNGLPNNQVEAIFKDSRGIIWVGTQNGLSKIENGNITNFYVEDGLCHNAVWDIVEDSKGNLWFGTYGGGIAKYDGKRFTIIKSNETLNSSHVRKLFIYKNKLLVGTEKGLYIIDLNTNNFQEFETNHDRFQIMDFILYKDEVYIAVYTSGIFSLSSDFKKLKKVKEVDEKKSPVFSLYLDGNRLYVGNDANGINNRLISKTGAVDCYDIENFINNKPPNKTFGKSIIWDYAKDNEANLYCSGWGVHSNNGGIYKIENNEFTDMSSAFGVDSYKVRGLYFDKQFNRLYVGTQDKGLYIVDLNQNIVFNKTENHIISDFQIIKDNLVLLHNHGLTIQNDKDTITINSNNFYKVLKSSYKQQSKSYFQVLSIEVSEKNLVYYKLIIRNNSIWVSTNYGLFEVNGDLKNISYYATRPKVFAFKNRNDLISPIQYGYVSIFTDIENNPIYYGAPEKNKFSPNNSSDINNPHHITNLAKSNKRLYLSSPVNGLFSFDDTKFTSLNNSGEFTEKEINHLTISKESNKLIASSNSGKIYIADITTDFELLKTINRSNYIGNSILFLETYKNTILVGTEKGLNVFRNEKFQFIDTEQGLDMVNFSSAKVLDSTLYVGITNGYYKLDLEAVIYQDTKPVTLQLSDVLVNHANHLTEDNIWFKQKSNKLKLPYNQNTLDLYFKSSNHPYPKKLLYSYQVQNLDSTWSNFSNSTNISLPYLPSGAFDVHVKTKDLNSGVVSNSKLTGIIILPPFWQTWWFIALIVAFLGLIMFLAYKKRIAIIKNREHQKAKIQKRLIETQLEALQSQMNPHFTFNALNSIQNYIIDNDVDNALMYLSEFAKLIRKTLDNSSQPLIYLEEEIDYLKSYVALENMRFNNKVEVSINFDNIDIHDIELPPMLIQPFVENAFVHAFDKTIVNPILQITFSIENQFLICTIADNGIGISKTESGQLHESKGLKLVTERLDLLKTSTQISYDIASKKGNGTTITLKIASKNLTIN